ncbi:MAG: TRAM domain-containing protein [Halobacteriaceae archaeon]
MPDCPIADECPSFTERIEGMGCQYYGNRGGKEWCNHYGQPIEDLKSAPVVPGEEVTITVTDMHESGAGVGHTEEGFVVMVDGVLPEARVRVEIENVKSNYAQGELIEKVQMSDADSDDEESQPVEEEPGIAEEQDEEDREDEEEQPRLGSRDNFWGA